MASYYLSGYTPPSGVSSRDQVKALQQQLGVTADGVWGPKTQAAYAQSNGGTQSYIPSEYKSILSEVQGLLGAPTVNYQGMSQAELSAGMRPSYDIAIANRRRQTGTERANIDTDAASRGMGRSTWVTDVKNRAGNREATDVASLEAGYAQQLMQALQAERANQFAADQFNASAKAQALQSALGLSGNLYSNYLSQQQSGGGGRRGGGDGDNPPTVEDWEDILSNYNTQGQRMALTGMDGGSQAFNALYKAVGMQGIEDLRRKLNIKPRNATYYQPNYSS